MLTAQFNELINVLARSHKLWVTIAGQELHQLPENLLQTVLTATAVLFGKTSDPEMAARLARRFYRYDPFKVKQSEPVQGVVVNPTAGGFMQPGGPAVYGTTHYRDTAYTQEEQTYFNSLDFQELAPKHFLFGRAEQEGDLPTSLEHITIASLDAGQYVDEERAARLRRKLTARDGALAAEILAEIEQRRRACPCLARPAFHHIVHGHDQHPPSPPAPPAAAAVPRPPAGTPTARPAREQSPAAARRGPRTPRPPTEPPPHTVAPPAGAIGRGPGR